MAKFGMKHYGVVYGILGALIGAVPVSIIKLLIMYSSFQWICTLLWEFPSAHTILTTCGPMYGIIYYDLNLDFWFLGYIVFILLGSGLFGFLAISHEQRIAEQRKLSTAEQKTQGAFWSFFAGVLFDIVFVAFLVAFP